MFKYLTAYEGKKVEVLIASQSSYGTLKEEGVLTGIRYQGENAVFIELDQKVLINARYIIKIDILD